LGFGEEVYALCFDPAGQDLYCGTRKGEILDWRVSARRVIHRTQAHDWPVVALVSTPDGRTIISGTAENVLQCWELPSWKAAEKWKPEIRDYDDKMPLPSGRLKRSWIASIFERPIGGGSNRGPSLETLAMSADGRYLVAAWKTSYVTVFDLVGRREYWHLKADTFAMFYSVALSPDGRFAIAPYNQIFVWDTESGCLTRKIDTEGYSPTVVACSMDGKYVITGTDHGDHSLRFWNLSTGTPAFLVHGHTGQIRKVISSSDGRWTITSSSLGEESRLRVWDVGAMVDTEIQGHNGKVFHASFSEDGMRAVTTGHDPTIRIWDPCSGAQLRCIELGMYDFAYSAQMPANGRSVLAHVHSKLKIWDTETGRELQVIADGGSVREAGDINISTQPTGVYSFSSDGRFVLFLELTTSYKWNGQNVAPTQLGERRAIKLWDSEQQTVLSSFDIDCDRVDSIGFGNADSRAVAMVRRNGEPFLAWWDIRGDSSVRLVPASAWWERGGRLFLLDDRKRIFDLESGMVKYELPKEAEIITVSVDGSRALVKDYDGLNVLNVPTGAVLLKHPDRSLTALNRNGSRIAFAQGASVYLWDVDANCSIGAFAGDGQVSAIALSPDGRTLVVGEGGGRVHIVQQVQSDVSSKPTVARAGNGGDV
jgi:WD40 repeat protein